MFDRPKSTAGCSVNGIIIIIIIIIHFVYRLTNKEIKI